MKKLIDSTNKFFIMMRCYDESRANFSRALARKEWEKIGETHFSLRNSFIAKMKSFNNEFMGKR